LKRREPSRECASAIQICRMLPSITESQLTRSGASMEESAPDFFVHLLV
jgi:hypothetical protein